MHICMCLPNFVVDYKTMRLIQFIRCLEIQFNIFGIVSAKLSNNRCRFFARVYQQLGSNTIHLNVTFLSFSLPFNWINFVSLFTKPTSLIQFLISDNVICTHNQSRWYVLFPKIYWKLIKEKNNQPQGPRTGISIRQYIYFRNRF